MKRLSLAAFVLAGCATALPAVAQFAKPEDAIKYRQGAMQVMGAHFGRVGAMANGKVAFDPKTAAENAAVVEFMSKLPFAGFVEGTDKGETRAKPAIWAERDKFNAGAMKMQEEVAKLNVAAKSGDLDQIKSAFGAAGKACKACHDDYRKE